MTAGGATNGRNAGTAPRPIAVNTVGAGRLAHERQVSETVVRPVGAVRAVARLVETNRLAEMEQRLVDEGDLPPAWAAWWLTLAAELTYNADLWSRTPALIIHRAEGGGLLQKLGGAAGPSYQLLPLTVSDVCAALPARAFLNTFALAWGASGADLNHASFPVVCRGAVLPVLDGLGALFLASEADLDALRAWTGGSAGNGDE